MKQIVTFWYWITNFWRYMSLVSAIPLLQKSRSSCCMHEVPVGHWMRCGQIQTCLSNTLPKIHFPQPNRSIMIYCMASTAEAHSWALSPAGHVRTTWNNNSKVKRTRWTRMGKVANVASVYTCNAARAATPSQKPRANMPRHRIKVMRHWRWIMWIIKGKTQKTSTYLYKHS